MNEYSEFLHNIEFINDVSKIFFKNKPSFDRINFAFIDGSHEYEDAKIEFDFIDKHNFKNDVIILDDYSNGFASPPTTQKLGGRCPPDPPWLTQYWPGNLNFPNLSIFQKISIW